MFRKIYQNISRISLPIKAYFGIVLGCNIYRPYRNANVCLKHFNNKTLDELVELGMPVQDVTKINTQWDAIKYGLLFNFQNCFIYSFIFPFDCVGMILIYIIER